MSGHVPKILEGIGKGVIFKELYESSPDLYRTIDLHGKIILCNTAYAKKLGYSMDEIKHHTIFDHVAEKSYQQLQATFEEWKQSGSVVNVELWLKKKDETDFPVLLSVNNLKDASGKLIGSNTVMRDISELESARREIESLKTQKFSIIGQLSARLAHDIRNPLTIIRGTLQILRLQNDEALKKYSLHLKRMENATMRIAHQIEEVMDYVRPKPLNMKLYSLQEIFQEIKESFEEYGDITINVSKNDIKIQCDENKIRIVFVNLILNAIQSMNNKGIIDIRIKEQNDKVILEFEDIGSGIPDDLQSSIFEPLFTTKQSGTGLGLASCKTIVEEHGGKIEVKSSLGFGTMFVIEIPKRGK